MFTIGQTISHYRILEKLGEGGMGVVYKAEDTKLGRPVALKFLPPALTTDAEARERFMQEARAASALEHRNICNIHDIEQTDDGGVFIAMAYYEGATLKERIEGGPLKVSEALDIAIQAADGLARAHEGGITHRDIKPANIMITDRGEVKLLDFGLAKLKGAAGLTKVGTTLGTTGYMSPEQAHGGVIDHRSDIWSLGVVLYEMVTGRRPFSGEYEQAIVYSILNDEPEPVTALRAKLPLELDRVIGKALAKNPSERYQTMSDLLVDLRSLEKRMGQHGEGVTRPKGAASRKRIAFAAGAAVIVVAAAIVAWPRLFPHRAASIDSIAVLPLDNLSGDPVQEYFADGMTDALITDLAKIGALKVISRTSVMRFKGTTEPLPKIARDLDVGGVVEGSVLLIGDRVRITAQLIEAANDRHIWAESYERDLRDVLSMQQEVARSIAAAIKVAVTPAEKAILVEPAPVDPKVHDLYLRGRYHWDKRLPEDLTKSIEYFESAIALDSLFAPAYAAMAEDYVAIANWGYADPRETYTRCKQYAEKAIEIDSTLPGAWASLAEVEEYLNFNWREAERLFRKAIALNPNYGTSHQLYALYLSDVGRRDEAFAEIEKARALDPLGLSVNHLKAKILYRNGRYEEAIAQCRMILDLDREFGAPILVAAFSYAAMGEYAEYAREIQATIAYYQKAPGYAEEAGRAFERGGREALWRWLTENIDQYALFPYHSPAYKAMNYAKLGNMDRAIEELQKAVDARSVVAFDVIRDPVTPLRDDPRFKKIMVQIGLTQ
jgi:TolB-like protein/tetratricopeptide (TPR) repeat protein/predicted Ser/Thr protein kinase